MNVMFKRTVISVLVAGSVAASSSALATNGMFMIGFGSKSIGMGGVGVAVPQDGLSMASNPATISDVPERFDLDVSLFHVKADAILGDVQEKSVGGLGGDSGAANWPGLYMMPGLGYVERINDKLTFGWNFVPVGGGGTNYKRNLYDLTTDGKPTGTPYTGRVGVSLFITQMNPTLAYALSKDQTLAATLVIGIQRFVGFGLGNFSQFTASNTPDKLTNQGSEWSYGGGLRLGWLGKYMDKRLNLGAVATSKVHMSKFHKYADLFAEQGDIDTPATYALGAAFKVRPEITVAMDLLRIKYGDVKSIANIGPNTVDNLYPVSEALNSIGNDAGLGFGWDDMNVVKLGMSYDYNRDWTYRVGWNYGKSPIKEEREIAFNIVAPAVTEHHVTLGATYNLGKAAEFNFAYMHAFTNTQSGPTYIGSAGRLRMSQDSLGVTLGYKF